MNYLYHTNQTFTQLTLQIITTKFERYPMLNQTQKNLLKILAETDPNLIGTRTEENPLWERIAKEPTSFAETLQIALAVSTEDGPETVKDSKMVILLSALLVMNPVSGQNTDINTRLLHWLTPAPTLKEELTTSHRPNPQ